MKKGILAAVLTAGFWGQQANAQINVSPSLKAAIDAGVANSKVLQNEALTLEKADNERKAVWNKYLPTVSANAAYAYLNNDLLLDIPAATLPITGIQLFEGSTKTHNEANVFAAGVTAKQVLFSGGQIMNGAKALEAKNEGNRYLLSIKQDELIKDIISSFDQLRLLAEAAALLNESELRLQKETERVEKAIEQGLAVPYDRDKIKLASLNLASRQAELAGKKQLLYFKINTLTGYDDQQIDAVDYALTPIEVDTMLNTDARNELKAMNSFSKALDYNLKKEKGSLLPTVGAFASYGYASLFNASSTFPLPVSGNQAQLNLNQATLSPNWMIGGILKWELFGGMERKHKIEAVKIDQHILANKKEDAVRMMNLQLKNNLVNYRVQTDRLAIAAQQEKIASNNLTTAEKQYKLGLIGVTERISAENDIYEVSLNKVQTLINQRQAALEAYAAAQPLIHSIQVK